MIIRIFIFIFIFNNNEMILHKKRKNTICSSLSPHGPWSSSIDKGINVNVICR